MMKKYFLKNAFLISTFVISQIHTLFKENEGRVDPYLLIDKTTRIDYVVYFTGITINFFILAYCLHYPKGVSKNISRFILIITILDIIHLVLLAKQGFGMSKIGIAFVIYIIYDLYTKNGERSKMDY